MVEVIDVTDWIRDEHHAVFPVGARDKEMLWSPNQCKNENIKFNWPYLFKESIYRYPDQYWTELVAYIVSKYLNVSVPKVLPAIKATDEGVVCGSLIEWFYDVKSERFDHASSYFKRKIPDFDDKQGKQHNFEDMNFIIRGLSMHASLVTDRMYWIADMALFDALIGNTDRHQENWGVVYQQDKACRLSPLFDNGTALGHERFLDRVKGWDDAKMRAYVNKGFHHLRFTSNDTKKRIQHFILIGGVIRSDDKIKEYIKQKISNLDFDGMLSEIENLVKIDIKVPFSQGRFDWVKKNLMFRLELIKEELNEEND